MTDHAEVVRISEGLDAVPETGADPALIQEAADALRRQSAEIERLRRLVRDSQAHRKLAELEAEIERLRAELEALRNQEPVAWMNVRNGFICKKPTNADYQQPLYPAAGAQPAPSVSDIVDRMSEFATHDIERGEMTFDKWSLREAVEATIVEAQPVPIPADAAQDMLAACKEFVRKVEAGEARSVRSYTQMKAAITKAENVQPAPSVPTIDRDTVYGDGFHDGYWKAKSEGMTADERKAVEALLADYDETLAAWSEKRERDGWDAVEEDESARIVRAMLAAAPATPEAPKRKPLTDEQIDALRNKDNGNLNFTFRSFRIIARAVEAAHGIKEPS